MSPPSDRFSLASSEHWTFCHDKDSPFVNDPDACADLVRRIRGGSHLMPETSELAFPDGFIASAQADVEVSSQLTNVYRELAVVCSTNRCLFLFPFMFTFIGCCP